MERIPVHCSGRYCASGAQLLRTTYPAVPGWADIWYSGLRPLKSEIASEFLNKKWELALRILQRLFCSKPIGHGAQFFIWWIESLTTAGGSLFRKTLVFIALLAP